MKKEDNLIDIKFVVEDYNHIKSMLNHIVLIHDMWKEDGSVPNEFVAVNNEAKIILERYFTDV